MKSNYARSPVGLSRELNLPLLGHFEPEGHFLERHEGLAAYALDRMRSSHIYQGVQRALEPMEGPPALWVAFLPDSWEQGPCAVGMAEAAAEIDGRSILAEVGEVHLPRPQGAPDSLDDLTRVAMERILEGPVRCWASDVGGVWRCIPAGGGRFPGSRGGEPVHSTAGTPILVLSAIPEEVGGWVPPADVVDGALLVAAFRDHSLPLLSWAVDRIRSSGHKLLGVVAAGPMEVIEQDAPVTASAPPGGEPPAEGLPPLVQPPVVEAPPIERPGEVQPPRIEEPAPTTELTQRPPPTEPIEPPPMEPIQPPPPAEPIESPRPMEPVEPSAPVEPIPPPPAEKPIQSPPPEEPIQPPPPKKPPIEPPPRVPEPPRATVPPRAQASPPVSAAPPAGRPGATTPPEKPLESQPPGPGEPREPLPEAPEPSPPARAAETPPPSADEPRVHRVSVKWAARYGTHPSLRSSLGQRIRTLIPWISVLLIVLAFTFWKLGPKLLQVGQGERTGSPVESGVEAPTEPAGNAAADLATAGGEESMEMPPVAMDSVRDGERPSPLPGKIEPETGEGLVPEEAEKPPVTISDVVEVPPAGETPDKVRQAEGAKETPEEESAKAPDVREEGTPSDESATTDEAEEGGVDVEPAVEGAEDHVEEPPVSGGHEDEVEELPVDDDEEGAPELTDATGGEEDSLASPERVGETVVEEPPPVEEPTDDRHWADRRLPSEEAQSPGREADDGILPFAVQVAALREGDRALREVQRLTALGFPADTVWVTIPHRGRWCRVIVGPYSEPAKAESAAAALREHPEVNAGFVVTRGGRGIQR